MVRGMRHEPSHQVASESEVVDHHDEEAVRDALKAF